MTAEALLTIFSMFGTPEVLVTDNGSNFTSRMMEKLLEALGISQIKSAPYHPEANGAVERLNRTIKEAITRAGATRRTWDKWLPHVLHAVRITTHSSTGHTPYELLFGRKPVTPISSLRSALEMRHLLRSKSL